METDGKGCSTKEKVWIFSQRIFLLGLIAGATWGSLVVKEAVSSNPRFQLANWTLEFGEFPDWVTPEIATEIETIQMQALHGSDSTNQSVLSRGILAEIREELLQNSWIAAIPNIQLLYPGMGGGGVLCVRRAYS